MDLSVGDKLGPYEINGLLGKGGMGEVYRGKDTRLHRDVAVRVSSERFNDRFEREARAVAALNHPHICAIYDVGPNYLVMELVEGETLSARIKQGVIPLDEALGIARQVAEALEVGEKRDVHAAALGLCGGEGGVQQVLPGDYLQPQIADPLHFLSRAALRQPPVMRPISSRPLAATS
ncbi:MAG: protein kinase [Bryobacteraceae bacterium]